MEKTIRISNHKNLKFEIKPVIQFQQYMRHVWRIESELSTKHHQTLNQFFFLGYFRVKNYLKTNQLFALFESDAKLHKQLYPLFEKIMFPDFNAHNNYGFGTIKKNNPFYHEIKNDLLIWMIPSPIDPIFEWYGFLRDFFFKPNGYKTFYVKNYQLSTVQYFSKCACDFECTCYPEEQN